MLNLNDILSYYPPKFRIYRENILKEYLQYQILNIIFSTKYSNKLVFLGGTAIRIIHNSTRFSEDLDFDNIGLSKTDFMKVSETIEKELQLEGYNIEIENVFKGAFHCYIKFPGLLFQNELSGQKRQKILIQLDTEPQKYTYKAEKYLLNKFGIFRYINIVPLNLLLSQKICACLTRKRPKGRDFFDVVFLSGKTNPDYKFLKKRLNIKTKKELIEKLTQKSHTLNFKILTKDIEPFLFDPAQKDRVINFKNWIKTI